MTLTGNTHFIKLDQAYPDEIIDVATGEILAIFNDSTVVLKVGLFNRNKVIDFTDIASLTFEVFAASDTSTAIITKVDSGLSTSVPRTAFDAYVSSHATLTLTASDLIKSSVPFGNYYVTFTLTTDSGNIITMGAGRITVIDKDTGVTDSSQLAVIVSSGDGDVVGPGSSTDNAITRFNGTGGKLLQNSLVTIDDSGNISVPGTVDGRDIAADGTKLDGIEALADVTDETNVLAALSGASVTSTPVATNDKVLIQDTSAADSLKTITVQSIVDLAGGGAVDSVNSQTGTVVLDADDISDTATTNKFTTAGDISKLAGIETGATADMTGAEIKSAYEGEANTNAFTDADHSKLDGIEASADVTDTANVTSALPLTTKGDVLVHNGSSLIRVGVGTNDQILTADSTQSAGVKWADASGGGGGGGMHTLLSTTVISGSPAAVDIDLSDASYTKFKIVFDKLKPTTNGTNLLLNFSFDGVAYAENMRLAGYRHYYGGSAFQTHGAPSYILGYTVQAGADSNGLVGTMEVFHTSTTTPSIFLRTFNHLNGTSFYDHRTMAGTIFDTTMPTGVLDSFRISPASGTLLSGTITVYGY